MKPSSLTHKDEARMGISNALIILVGFVALPYLVYLVSRNFVLAIIAGLIFAGFMLDVVLTALGVAQGYREANFYRKLFQKFGDVRGMEIAVSINAIIRAVVVLILMPFPILLFLVSLVFFAAPLWNALSFYAFHNDIVLTVPTVVSGEFGESLEIPTIEKRRLETQKDATFQDSKIILTEASCAKDERGNAQ